MKKYHLANNLQIGALVPVLLLTFLCLGSFILLISDLGNVLEGEIYNSYSSISFILELAICIVLFIAIYLFLDNIFSMEMEISERGIEIHSNNIEINAEWAEIENLYEDTPPIIGKYRYIHLNHKKKIFTKGLIGKLFFWINTNNIYYMIFEEEAIQNIEAKCKN